MQANVLNFPTQPRRPAQSTSVRHGNVVRFDEWRAKVRIRRTCHGVFFTGGLAQCPGDAA